MAISSNQNASAPTEKNSKQPQPVTLEVDEETMKFKAVNIPICDPETLISLLDSSDTAVCNMALEYLTKFAEISPQQKLLLLDYNILDHLCTLVNSEDVNIKKNAFTCLSITTELDEPHEKMRDHQFLELLLNVLKKKDEQVEIIEEAAYTIANLAKDFAWKAEIRKSGGMKLLVPYLEAQDPDIKKNVTYAIASLLEDIGCRTEIRLVGGIPLLIELLNTEYPEILENVITCITKCAEDFSNRIEIRKHNGIKKIIDLLFKESAELYPLTIECIAVCLEDNETNYNISNMGGLTIIVKFLSSEDLAIKRNASLALSKIARIEHNHSFIRDEGAIPILASNLTHPDNQIVITTAMAVAKLAKQELFQTELYKDGAVEKLIKQLESEDNEVVCQCLIALASFSENIKLRASMKQLKATLPTLNLLSSEDNQVLINACNCIDIFARDSNNREELIANGVVEKLVEILSNEDPSVQSVAVLALSRCMQDSMGRQILNKIQGVKKIIELLDSKDNDVCRNASWTLSSAAVHKSIVLEACHMGVIEALLKLTHSISISSFADDALSKILKHHLPAKYWLNNSLSHEDIISNGFYDLGYAGSRVGLNDVFPTLKELSEIPIDKKREIIVIDVENDTNLKEMIDTLQFKFKEIMNMDYNRDKDSFSVSVIEEKIRAVANVVCDAMGGQINPEKLGDFAYKFAITEKKLNLNSNIIPIGEISAGIFYHRALLFKVLMDFLNMTPMVHCTLYRSGYNRAWNTLELIDDELIENHRDEGEMIVDLMFNPGELLKVGTVEATNYQKPT